MDTKDLDSYYPGYDEYNETTTIATEEYQDLKEQIDIYEKFIEDLEELFNDKQQYEASEMIEESLSMLEDLKKEVGDL